MYKYTYICINTHVCLYIHTRVYTGIYIFLYTYIHSYIHIYIFLYTYIFQCTNIYLEIYLELNDFLWVPFYIIIKFSFFFNTLLHSIFAYSYYFISTYGFYKNHFHGNRYRFSANKIALKVLCLWRVFWVISLTLGSLIFSFPWKDLIERIKVKTRLKLGLSLRCDTYGGTPHLGLQI